MATTSETTELCFLPAVELAARIRRRDISPVEVVAAYLRRIEERNPVVNAYTLVLADQAMEAARKAEAVVMSGEPLGALHGVPVAIKDLDDVAAGFLPRHGRRLRIATKYWSLTQGFFASHGIALYRIVESLGATEGAPAAGKADLVVDITTTGATLAANHLKVLDDGVILRSEAHLVLARRAPWSAALDATAASLARALGGSRRTGEQAGSAD